MSIQRLHVGPRMSEVAIHQGVVYLAGQVAEDPSQDVAGQTRQILAAIDRLLKEAGSDKTRLLQVTIFLADRIHLSVMSFCLLTFLSVWFLLPVTIFLADRIHLSIM